jgi:hypothetical protein
MDMSILHSGHQQARHRDDLGFRAHQIAHFVADRNDAVALYGDLGTLRPGGQERPATDEGKICKHLGYRITRCLH